MFSGGSGPGHRAGVCCVVLCVVLCNHSVLLGGSGPGHRAGLCCVLCCVTSVCCQVAAVLGIGLVYQGTGHRHNAEVMLAEIGDTVRWNVY